MYQQLYNLYCLFISILGSVELGSAPNLKPQIPKNQSKTPKILSCGADP